MPTDKIIPRVLNISTDERLHQEGDMLDALNVTIDESGDGTFGVLKNVNGTKSIPHELNEATYINADSVVVGSVSDEDNRRIIFFVYNGNKSDGVYMYDDSPNSYRILAESVYFNFNPNYPVKADIINTYLSDDNQVDTLVYFTDNYNPPRKLNINKADSGYYDTGGNTDLFNGAASFEEIVSVCKGPIPLPPRFRFDTDNSVEANNFHTDFFQFATQLIYDDGEVSAISPYSKIAYPDHVSIQGIDDAGTGALYKNDNVCLIDPMFAPLQSTVPMAEDDYLYGTESEYKYSVSKIRLLCRIGNGSAFYVIDEYNPYEELTRNIYGTEMVVYSPSTREYRFYNSLLYSLIPDREVNKLFDNVPLTAEGQVIQGERLCYSNYTEGYPNFPVSPSIEVNYLASNNYGENVSDVLGDTNGDIVISLTDAIVGGIVPANTKINISFLYKPQEETFISMSDGSDIIVAKFTSSSYYIDVSLDDLRIDGLSTGIHISRTIETNEDVDITALFNLIQQEFSGLVVSYTYTQEDQELYGVETSDDPEVENGDPISVILNQVVCNIEFHEMELDVANQNVIIKPFISFASISNATLPNNPGYSVATQTYGPVEQRSDVTYNPLAAGYIVEGSITGRLLSSYRTFKAGCSHDLGIVFYDKFNRSSFVNKIGSFYVDPFNDENRAVSDGTFANGPAYVKVSFPLDAPYPDWASYYQLVYTGPTTFDSFFSYTTGGAYLERYEGTNSHPIREESRKIYVSLKTLDYFVKDKAAEKSYVYSKGDILRVISYEADNGTTVFPRSQLGNLIEFRVVGFDYLTNAHEDNPINEAHSTSTDPVEDAITGSFVILEAPVTTSGDDAYQGFDYYSVYTSIEGSAATHPYTQTDSSYIAGDSLWGHKTTIEILTPTTTKENNVYYEIGEARRLLDRYDPTRTSAYGSPIVTNEGSAYIRPCSCITANYNLNTWDGIEAPETWSYETIFLEVDSITDFIESKYWSKGRPHTVYDQAGTYRRFNGITYSDRYAEDSEVLTLSNFNQSAFNWISLDAGYGAVRYIGRYSDNMVAIQQNKVSRLPVNANTVSYGDGMSNMTVSEQFLGRPVYFAGDYGCGDSPESVVSTELGVFFCDRFRKKVLFLGAEGIVSISDNGVSSFIEEQFSLANLLSLPLVVGGYDPNSTTYFVTIRSNSPVTIGYDAQMKRWRSRYSFTPTDYAQLGNDMYSFTSQLIEDFNNEDPDDDIYTAIHVHNSDNRAQFYGVQYPSSVQVVSKFDPSMMKVFGALTLECDNNAWIAQIATPGGQNTGNFSNWRVRERGVHHEIPRDIVTAPPLIYVGVVDAIDDNVVTFNLPVSSLYIPYGSVVYSEEAATSITFLSFNSYNSVNVTDGSQLSVGDTIHVAPANAGNPIRDYFCTISLTNNSPAPYELFSINTHFDRSNLGAELTGQ